MLIIKIIVCVIWVDLLYNVIYSELIGNIDISILPSVVLRDRGVTTKISQKVKNKSKAQARITNSMHWRTG